MTPGRVAIVGGGVECTYAELDERCRRLANGLAGLGVARGDRVAYLGRNDSSLVESLFATTALGAIFVPLNWRLTAGELAYITADCGADVLVHATEFAAAAAAVNEDPATRLRHLVELGGDYDALIDGAAADARDHPIAMDDPAMIIYTSGTTGRPKGATLSHANITWNCVNVLIDTELAADEVALVCAPLFHVAALNMITLPTIMKGGTVRLLPQFDADDVLAEIERHRVTVLFGVPAMFNAIAQSAAWPDADLSSLRRALCGGAPVPLATIRTYLERGVAFLQGYGMTETSPGALFLTADRAADKAGTAGVASFFTDVRVVRPDGTDVAPGEKGEVIVSGPNVMLGYWGLPEATGEAIRDEWFHSGDVAVVDADGFATIVDRLKDVIISGGENVYPAEVEDAFYTHPAVADCAVIGVADETWGEAGRAVVVLRDGSAASTAELLDHVRQRLAGYKVPKTVVFADALPRSGAGKLLKNVLRERYGSHVMANGSQIMEGTR
jgi:fatty-acyl-CoA synthase